MPLQIRRTHTKSRGGCLECKRRKIKCNEEKPICSGCVKRCIPCEYSLSGYSRSDGPSPSGVSTLDGTQGRSHTPTTPAPPPYEAASSSHTTKALGKFDMDDMALLHQFLTETAATIAGPWEKEIPRLATSCDYLMHIILSTAALHLAYLNPEQRDKYEYIASQHRDLGIGPFRWALSKITVENCNEVFAYSSLMILAQFAPSHSPNEVFLPSPTPALYKGPANWIVCFRGCASVANQAMPYIRAGPLGILIAQGTQVSNLARTVSVFPENDDDRSIEYISEHLLKLPSIKASTTVDEMESYIEAISWLRRLLAASSADSDSLTCRIFSSIWPTQISDTFIRTLNEDRPAALVITAHYCLLLQRCHSCWYMEHRANALLMSIQQSLATGWAPYIERPVKVIQNAQLDPR
ncbi:hypothetical protein OIDMADRAFT_181899 [Oidiodendron maius Zn]|uniref:Zn(2)-C6 fungal-type domain-containing protein n=1 Tax=Oidiodendron maius (strain Zn) TaxID=913774 RepID=A0A0C3H8D0_OIDMZ|nr:hypothetical protein OIDMADRAFT_181899 [Oidiodendron maius Zn]